MCTYWRNLSKTLADRHRQNTCSVGFKYMCTYWRNLSKTWQDRHRHEFSYSRSARFARSAPDNFWFIICHFFANFDSLHSELFCTDLAHFQAFFVALLDKFLTIFHPYCGPFLASVCLRIMWEKMNRKSSPRFWELFRWCSNLVKFLVRLCPDTQRIPI